MEVVFNFILLAGSVAGTLFFIGTQLGKHADQPTSKEILTASPATMLSLHKATLCRYGITDTNTFPERRHRS